MTEPRATIPEATGQAPGTVPVRSVTPGPTIEEIEPVRWPTVAPARVPPSAGRVGLRWTLALVVVALLVAVSAAGAWFLAGQSSAATLAGWVPSDSVVYGEARIDLPGDQRQQLGNLLAHFPGFKDQSILDDKIAETFDRAIRDATNGSRDYSTEIRPWFTGELAFAVGRLPEPTSDGSTMRDVRAIVLAGTKDRAATEAWIDKLVAASPGARPSTGTYKGASLWTSTKDHGFTTSVAVLDRVVLAGDDASVRAAIDTGGSAGLAANGQFRAALDRLGGDHLGATYVDVRAYMAWALRLAQARASAASTAVPTLDPSLGDLLPAWVAGDVRATNGDALTGRYVSPHASGAPIVPRGPSVLPAHIPSTALAVFDSHDYGRTLVQALATYRSLPATQRPIAQVDQALALLGGPETAFGWMGETALVVARDGSALTAGLVVSPTAAEKAHAFGRQLRNLLALGGSAAGVTTRDEDHNGTTITIVDAGDLASIMARATGAPGRVPVAGHLEVAFAVRDDLVAVGAPAFVRSALDTTVATSLASSARFAGALARVGADSPRVGWIDVTAIRETLEALAPAGGDRDRYVHDIQPYLAPLDQLAFGAATASDGDTGTFTLITK